MIHLPLKLAASVPVAIVGAGAFLLAMTSTEGQKLHPVYGTSNAALIAFLASGVALLLVLPNVTAAYVANRNGSAGLLPFATALGAVSIGAFLLELSFVGKFLGIRGGVVNFADWRLYAALLLNFVTLLATAFLASGRNA